jgi:phosphatidylglycerol---prolipoprotein diacylglyceryl transferase
VHPILLDIELFGQPLKVHAYGAAMVSAVVVIALVGWAIAVRRGVPGRPALVHSLAIALAMPIGSRLFYWAVKSEWGLSQPELLARPQFNGFYVSGGLAAALLAGLFVCRIFHLRVWRMADAIAPALGIGGAILRLGCFLNGCCFGHPTSAPWGVTFPVGSPAHLHQGAERFDLLVTGPLPVHPTQLYEMAAALIAAAIAWLLYRRQCRDGVPALAAAIWFLVFRWMNAHLRADGFLGSGPAWLQTAIYAALLLLCASILLWRVKTPTPIMRSLATRIM